MIRFPAAPVCAWPLVGWLLVACGPGPAPDADAPPNIVLLLVDTLRRDHLSPYGADVETPTVQRLADAGQVFARVQASYHQTTMSMAALFTGRTPSLESEDPQEPLTWDGRRWCGMARFAEAEDSCVPRGIETLAEALQDAGYWTAGVVANRLLFAPAGYEQGFDRWDEVSADRDDLPIPELAVARAAPAVNAALERALRDRPRGPAFVYVHFVDVHDYHATDESYRQAVERFDRELARTLEILAAAGLGERTVLFLLSDHGESLGEEHGDAVARSHYGNPSYQAQLEIPLIVRPAIFEDTERWLRSVDVTGLILQAARIEEPLAAEDLGLAPDELFLSERRFVTYRKGRYKTSFHRTKLGRWMLWDLEVDPGETRNLISERKQIGLEHLARAQEIAAKTVARQQQQQQGGLTEEDQARLRALGYVE